MVNSYWFLLPYYNPHICGLCSEMERDYAIKLVVFDSVGNHRIGKDWDKKYFNHLLYNIKNYQDIYTIVRQIGKCDIVGCLGLTYSWRFFIMALLASSRCDNLHIFSEGFKGFSHKRAMLVSLFPWHKAKLFGIGRGAVEDYKKHCFIRRIDKYVSGFAYPFDLVYPVLSVTNRRYFSTYCGQLIQRKNVESYLRFVQKVVCINPNARFQIIGEGPERENLERYCSDLGLSDQVDWLGNLSRNAVLSAFANSQSFYLNSHYDGWGAVCLEAMSCGCFLLLGWNVRANILVTSSKIGVVFKDENDIYIEHIINQLDGYDIMDFQCIQSSSRKYSASALYKCLNNDNILQDQQSFT